MQTYKTISTTSFRRCVGGTTVARAHTPTVAPARRWQVNVVPGTSVQQSYVVAQMTSHVGGVQTYNDTNQVVTSKVRAIAMDTEMATVGMTYSSHALVGQWGAYGVTAAAFSRVTRL